MQASMELDVSPEGPELRTRSTINVAYPSPSVVWPVGNSGRKKFCMSKDVTKDWGWARRKD